MSVRMLSRVWEQSAHNGTDLLMMLAIADFADDDGNAYPAVGTLASKCRMTSRNANHILAHLRESGELEVRQNEGPKGTNLYKIHLDPLKRTSPLKQASPLKHTSAPPEAHFPKPLKPTSAEPSVNRQEPSTRSRATSPKFDARTHLTGLGISDDLIGDWLTLRKQKRAAVTKTAVDGIHREASKAGITLLDALRMCCERGWVGFNASWLQDNKAGTPHPGIDQFRGAI